MSKDREKKSAKKRHRSEHKRTSSSDDGAPSAKRRVSKNKEESSESEHKMTSDYGGYQGDAKEWVWDFTKDCRLRVGQFRDKVFVDIRHLWQGHPTKKGVFLTVEAFKALQEWPCLDEALNCTKKAYRS